RPRQTEPGTEIAEIRLVGVISVRTREEQPALGGKLARRHSSRDRVLGIRRRRGCRNRVVSRWIEAADAAIEPLGRATVAFKPETEIQRQVRAGTKIVLRKEREVFRLLSPERVNREASGGRVSENEGREVLPQRRRRRIIERPPRVVFAERESA